jgi:hypothetical protein
MVGAIEFQLRGEAAWVTPARPPSHHADAVLDAVSPHARRAVGPEPAMPAPAAIMAPGRGLGSP